MGGVADTLAERARTLIHTWGTRGTAPRPLPPDLVRAVYLLWVLAFVLKVLGASWDVSWHFKWLRDDLAPPHLLNSAGTALVVALVVAHGWTGRAVDRPALRLQQVGLGIFLVAIPLDVINHRINGLDLTAWSPTHALLYLGTAVILAGVVRGWWIFGSGRARLPVLVVLWLFVLENVWFPAQQQEYGVLAVAAWDRGAPEAEPILLQFAADQIGRPVDRAAVLHFALPTPAWVYPVWLLAAAGLVLVLARWMIGRPWAATAVAGGYVAYRCVAWVALRDGSTSRRPRCRSCCSRSGWRSTWPSWRRCPSGCGRCSARSSWARRRRGRWWCSTSGWPCRRSGPSGWSRARCCSRHCGSPRCSGCARRRSPGGRARTEAGSGRQDGGEPGRDGGGDAREIRLERVVAARSTTSRPGAGGGRPNGSRSPWTTSTGTVGSASSARRSFSGRPGGCTGKARHSTATAPTADAVRHATRAPELRPPTSSGSPGSAARTAATTASHAASSCAAGAGARRPATR